MEEKTDSEHILENRALLETYGRYQDRILPPEEWMRRQFEARIRDGFSGITYLEPATPQLKELIDYSQTLEKKFAQLQEPVGLSPGLARNYMDRIPPRDLKAEFDHVVLKLRNETSYLKELEDVGIAAALLTRIENGKYGAWVKFLAPDSFLAQSLSRGKALGSYNAMLDTAFIYSKPPKPKEIWLLLAAEGKLPEELSSLDHELTHDAQYSKIQRTLLWFPELTRTGGYFAILLKYGFFPATAFSVATRRLVKIIEKVTKNERIIAEIHAYEAAASSPTYAQDDLDKGEEIVKHVVSVYGKNLRGIYEALRAFETIQTLRLLGLNDQEIGQLVSRARFDLKSGIYPKLDERIAEERKNWGIEDERSFQAVRRTLLARQELELHVQRHHAQKIAAEELEIAAGKKSWLKEEKT